MSEENFNRLVSSELQGNSYLHSETVYSIRWAQNEIKSLREEVERLQAVIDEANTQEPFDFYEVAEEIESRNLDQPTYLGSSGISSYELYELLSKLKLYASPMPAQQSPTVPDVVKAVADFVEKQEGGPYMPQVISAAIRGTLMYRDTFKNISSAFDGAKAPCITEQDVKTVVAALVKHIERETCLHEETHRGGFIWEICDSCGQQGADDNGGKPEFKWPSYVDDARALLNKLNTKNGG